MNHSDLLSSPSHFRLAPPPLPLFDINGGLRGSIGPLNSHAMIDGMPRHIIGGCIQGMPHMELNVLGQLAPRFPGPLAGPMGAPFPGPFGR